MESGKRKRDDDIPRVTYVAGDRTFERLFKETSLGEMKEVVRRKLLLPLDATIKLKQLRDNKTIDLDDDDDFDAFCVQARSLMSIESIDVAVDVSSSSATNGHHPIDASASMVARPQPKKPNKVADRPVPAASSEPSNISAAPKSTNPTKKTTRASTSKVISTQILTEPAEKSSTDLPDEQPPKKKPKTAKAGASKDETATSVATKRKKKSPTDPIEGQPPEKPKTALDGASKDVTLAQGVTKSTEKPPTVSVDGQPPKKKTKTAKADDSSNATDPTDMSDFIATFLARLDAVNSSNQQYSSVDRPSENQTDNILASSEQAQVKGKQKEKEVTAQASKPSAKTSAPIKARKEAVADVAVPKEKKTKERKATKAKVSNADVSRPLDPLDIQDIVNRIADATTASSNGVGKAKTQAKTGTGKNLVNVSQPSASSKTALGGVSSSRLCHICFGSFHPLYQCPTVLGGRDAIQNKLEELKKAGSSEHRLAINDLEALFNSSSVAVSSAAGNVEQKDLEHDNESERRATKAAKKTASHSQPSWTPPIPSNSLLSEVTVESRHEGSSSEEEDEFDQEADQEERDVEAALPSFDDIDLDEIVRGPAPIKLENLISTMESKEHESDTEDEGDDIGVLEVEDDEVEERKYRRLSRPFVESSEQEDDEDDDTNEHRLMLPSKQNIPDALPPLGGSEISVRHNGSISNPQAGSRTDVVPTSDTDDTRVSVTGAPDRDKNLAEDASDMNKVSDISPIGDKSLHNNDPIEPADDLVGSPRGEPIDIDPIEATTPPSLKATIPLSPPLHSTPKPGIVKRLKDRHGKFLSQSQFPVRADQPEVNNGLMAKNAKVAVQKSDGKPSIRGSTGADLPCISSQPARASAKVTGNARTPFRSQPVPKAPLSLARWDAIQEPSPSITSDDSGRGSPLVDGPGDILGELAGKVSDRHETGECSDDDSASKSKEPLFTLTASQVPFPYSQYNGHLPKRLETAPDSDTDRDTNSGGKEKGPIAKARGSVYRKLSDIASQSALFSQRPSALAGSSSMASQKGWQEDDDDDETSSSDSDSENQSHIPMENRAGKLPPKKSRGLFKGIKF